jgi:hypothetical protein
MLTVFEVMACGTMLLLFPCALAGLLFGFGLVDIVAQLMLVAVAGTAILTAIAIHEGWYAEHLSRFSRMEGVIRRGTPRQEPTLRRPARKTADVALQAENEHHTTASGR